MIPAYAVWRAVVLNDGRWVPSQPIPGPFLRRLQDAWAVLTGEAEAVNFDVLPPRTEGGPAPSGFGSSGTEAET